MSVGIHPDVDLILKKHDKEVYGDEEHLDLGNMEKNIDPDDPTIRRGMRLRFDKDVDREVRRACKEFAAFLRKKYYFPIRVTIYIKKKYRIIAMDGVKCVGTFWRIEDDYTVEPVIRMAAGDYSDMYKKWGKDQALGAILHTMTHELTHYFQWINSIHLTSIGEERQATVHSDYIIGEYAEINEHP